MQAYYSDRETVVMDRAVDIRKQQVKHEICTLLQLFLHNDISITTFNTIFQHKTHLEWGIFGVRGFSGGLFLNKLVKHLPDEVSLEAQLRLVLSVPKSVREGRQYLRTFLRFLEDVIASGQVTRGQVQPARVPCFVSFWWSLQNERQWPHSISSIRDIIMSNQGAPETAGESTDPVENYFRFRQQFLALRQACAISSWELEHLLNWGDAQKRSLASPVGHSIHLAQTTKGTSQEKTQTQEHSCQQTEERNTESVEQAMLACFAYDVAGTHQRNISSEQDQELRRLHLQWLLAKIGARVGCQVWIAERDHEKTSQGERLGDLSLSTFPLSGQPGCTSMLWQIDILWLYKNKVVAAYEIEPDAQEIGTSLLRLYHLGSVIPRHQVSFCLVTSKHAAERLALECALPILDKQRQHWSVLHEEDLLEHAEHILRWASSPLVVQQLAAHI